MATQRIPSLDGLRAISISLVLIDHFARGVLPDTPISEAVFSLGDFGVKIFFVISGYLITLLMLRERQDAGEVSLRQFYTRRAFRILPAAFVFMAVVFIWNGSSIAPENKFLAPLFLENYAPSPDGRVGHLWSLGVEEQFYLLWPLLFTACAGFRKKILFLTMAAVPVINVAIIWLGWPYWGRAFYSVADVIACGCLLAMLRNNAHLNRVLDSRLFFLIPILTPLLSLACVLKGGVVFGLCKSLLLRPAINIGIALSLEKAVHTAPAILNTEWIMKIGAMSYSIYLWQQPFSLSQSIDFLPRILLIAILSSASYFLVEQPFLKLRRAAAMKRVAVGMLLLALIGTAHGQMCKAPTPPEKQHPVTKAELERQIDTMQAKLNDWPNLARFRDENAALPPVAPSEKRVVFLGDSIVRVWHDNYWQEFFAGKPYIARGIDGQTTPQILLRVQQDVIHLNPSVVVILAGINDIAGNTGTETPQMVMDNIMSMVAIARANNIKVVVSSILPSDYLVWMPDLNPAQQIRDMNAQLKAMCDREGLVYLDYYSAMVNSRGGLDCDLTIDGVHPTEKGYAIMAPLTERAIAEALSK